MQHLQETLPEKPPRDKRVGVTRAKRTCDVRTSESDLMPILAASPVWLSSGSRWFSRFLPAHPKATREAKSILPDPAALKAKAWRKAAAKETPA